MRKIIVATLLSLLAFALPAQGQLLEPVKWKIAVEDLGNGEAEIILTADIDDPWYLYSQNIDEGGPIPTNFDFGKGNGFELTGETSEESDYVIEGEDKIFEMYVKKMKKKAIFRQRIKITDPNETLVGSLLFQTCDDQQCLPPTDVPFAVKFKELNAVSGENAVANFLDKDVATGVGDTIEWPDYGQPISDCKLEAAADDTTTQGKGTIFIWGLLGGLLALLTPCVFPMIPLTVAFFTKRQESKGKGVFEASLYGVFIFLIYAGVALPFLFFNFSPDTFYQISTSPWLNLAFFAIFVFFALSFFGFYELTLPSSWANKAESASNVGGILGIFFMALVLVIVSFSCTGPIVGGLMGTALSTAGGPVKLLYGMMGFGVALGLPFALFAMFPSWLDKLPKSGGWMNTVKAFIGFLELALALKFLSNADLVKQWGLLKYEIFLGLLILITLAMSAYMFGLLRLPSDYTKPKIAWPRIVTGVAGLALCAYMATGLMGNILKAFSGFPPPKFYSINKNHKSDIPHGLRDLDEGITKAKTENKPVLVDFTGWSCINCRKVEENIWTNEEVAKKLNDDVVLVSLYVDDRTELPENEQYRSEKLNRLVNSIGEKWTDFEASSFGHITQPYYVLISPDKKLLNTPIAYTNSVDAYLAFLDCGIDAYKSM